MSRIRSATIVILLTPPSSSAEASSVEDYRDFEEVHLDNCFRNTHDTEASHRNYFLDELSRKALEAADRSEKVVVRYMTSSSQNCQESLVRRLISGGASDENITVVRLAMDHSYKTAANGSSYRTNYCTWRPKTVLA